LAFIVRKEGSSANWRKLCKVVTSWHRHKFIKSDFKPNLNPNHIANPNLYDIDNFDFVAGPSSGNGSVLPPGQDSGQTSTCGGPGPYYNIITTFTVALLRP
jgi:hypothetical protein